MTDPIVSNAEKHAALEKILKSSEFEKSETNQRLLQYLFDASLKGESKKEVTIALEFFNKDSSFDSSEDPSVRVYISKLRKMLDYYYKSSGVNDIFKLQIPKGHYDIVFIKKDKPKPLKSNNKIRFISLLVVIVVLSIVIILQTLNNQNNFDQQLNKISNSLIWSEFLQNDKPILLVLGDYYFLFEYSQEIDQRLFIRDPKINSNQDLDIYLEKYPNKKDVLFPLEFSYLRPSSALSLIQILPILEKSENEIITKLASELVWSDIENSNVIYIGPIKNMNILRKLLEKLNLSFKSNPLDSDHSRLYLHDDSGKIQNIFEPTSKNQEESYRDFGIISKIRSSKNSVIMFIVGFDELAIMKAVRMVTDPNFETLLKNDFVKDEIQSPFYFNMIFGVEGFRRTDLSYEVKHFTVLP